MFRPINSDDHTRFRPPAEHLKQVDPVYRGHKRDFSYEVEQVNDEHKNHSKSSEEPFGEDTFEASTDQENDLKNSADGQSEKDRTPPAPGHVDVQI